MGGEGRVGGEELVTRVPWGGGGGDGGEDGV